MSAGLKFQLLKNQLIMHPTIHFLTTIPPSNLIEISGGAKLVCSHSAHETLTLSFCPPRSSLTLLFSMNMSPLFFTVISPEPPVVHSARPSLRPFHVLLLAHLVFPKPFRTWKLALYFICHSVSNSPCT